MTDLERLLAAGDALAKALEASCVWCRCEDCTAVEIATEAYRAIAREVKENSDD